ncbi:MAG: hypothetical protein WBQ23_07090 [Bacteroidota bacterium]
MRLSLFIALLLCFAASASAQFKQGNVELMLLGTAGSFSDKSTYTSKISPTLNYESDESHTYLYVSIMPSWYFIDRLAAELELGLRAMEEVRPTQSVILHVAYTQPLARSPLALFARAGYGVANGYSIPVFLELMSDRTDGFDVSIINLGAGLKIRAGGSALIRGEINYRIQSLTQETDFSKSEQTYGTLSLLLGVGVLL